MTPLPPSSAENPLGETQHESLGGGVSRHEGHGLERGGRGDVDDRAAPARDHRGQQHPRQLDQRDNVEIDLLAFAREVQAVEAPGGAETGVVDEAIDFDSRGLKAPAKLLGRFAASEVDGDYLDPIRAEIFRGRGDRV